jgi:hypothetical protein
MKTENPLPANVTRFGGEIPQFPRRHCIDKYHPAEAQIREAHNAVEALGADALLTQASTLINQAQELVADWLEGKTGDYVNGKLVIKE